LNPFERDVYFSVLVDLIVKRDSAERERRAGCPVVYIENISSSWIHGRRRLLSRIKKLFPEQEERKKLKRVT
jgi:hypothetical protein